MVRYLICYFVKMLNYSGPITFTMVLNNQKVKVPAQILINFPDKHYFEVRTHVYSGRALTSPDVSGYCSKYSLQESLLKIFVYVTRGWLC